VIYYFGISDFTYKNEEFLKQFTWLNYARLHLDRTYFYEPKQPLYLRRYGIFPFFKTTKFYSPHFTRNLRSGMGQKDRMSFVFKNLNSEAKIDYNHHGFTGYLIARDFVQYRGPKSGSKYKSRRSLNRVCETLRENEKKPTKPKIVFRNKLE